MPHAPRRHRIHGVTMVDTRDGTLTPQMTIVVEDGRIVSIAATAPHDASSPDAIDANGRFAVPGFLDMHAHVVDAPAPDAYRRVLLARGITGFRQMSGSADLLERRRAGAFEEAGLPRVLAMPGNILTPLSAPTPEKAVAEVDRQREQGADFIKVLDCPPTAFFAALARARELGLPFAGHLPATVDAFDASEAGMRSIEHLGPRDSILAGCDCAGHAAAVAGAAQTPRPSPPGPPPGIDPAAFFARMIANPLLFTDPAEFDRYRRVIDAFDDAACDDLAQTFVRNGTWQVPTLVRLRTMAYADDALYREDNDLRYVAPASRALWAELASLFAQRLSSAMRQAIRDLYALQERLLGRLVRAGVAMLAGSDLGGQWVMPGSGLHAEFDLLAGAGVSPLRVLQMTTLDGARFLRREADLGRVAIGAVGDIVLLDENPVAAVSALHTVSGVLHDGIYRSHEELDADLDAVALALRSAG